MSLILDALKKAEAERQFGQIPSLHVQPLAALPAEGAPSRARKLWLGLAAALMIAVIAGLAWLRPWQNQVSFEQNRIAQEGPVATALPTPATGLPVPEAPAAPPQQTIAASPQPETYKPPAKPPVPQQKAPAATPRSMPADSVATSAPPVKTASSVDRHTEPSPTAKPAKPTATAAVNSASADTSAKSASKQSALRVQPIPTGDLEQKTTALASSDTATPTPRELPEQIQRELPNLVIGGYIYSDNPRERQLLVNRRLLHEGEEAAPGVTLEKMTPRAAVFNYRGYRYRMAY